MSLQKHLNKGLFIGIDGGGSKCKAVIVNRDGEILGRGVGGPANPFYGIEKTLNSIVSASEHAIDDAQLTRASINSIVAGVGLAGVNLPALRDKITAWEHPFAQMYLTTDMDIANIGAHAGKDGAVIIVGTGSCGFISQNGTKRMLGGHGFPIGDKGSGAWLGLKAIEHTLLAMDQFEQKGILTEKISQYFEVDNGISLSEKLIGKASQHYAKVASLVFECAEQGDQRAIQIVQEGARYISQLAKRLLANEPARLSMIGGLAHLMLPQLEQDIRAHFDAAKQPPELGGYHFALEQLERSNVSSVVTPVEKVAASKP